MMSPVLCWLQMESTMAMQAVQPRVKDLQAKYANEPETLQVRRAVPCSCLEDSCAAAPAYVLHVL